MANRFSPAIWADPDVECGDGGTGGETIAMTAEGVHRLPSHISKTVLSIVKTGPPKADPGVILVLGSRRHRPEQIINKLRDADFPLRERNLRTCIQHLVGGHGTSRPLLLKIGQTAAEIAPCFSGEAGSSRISGMGTSEVVGRIGAALTGVVLLGTRQR